MALLDRTALLIIDMINPLDFAGAENLTSKALDVATVIASLRDQADDAEAPVVYVNDNYGHWRSDRNEIVEHCRAATPAAAQIISCLEPRKQDYFIIKPQFSGFYATNLPVLLPKIGVSQLILTGLAGDICVLFTAADAHMREYDLWAPSDAVASEHDERNAWALDIMRKSMGVETAPTTSLNIDVWKRREAEP